MTSSPPLAAAPGVAPAADDVQRGDHAGIAPAPRVATVALGGLAALPSVGAPAIISHVTAGSFSAGLALALTGSILFSAKAIFIKLSYRYGVDAVTLIALRMAFSLPFFLFALWWTSLRKRAGGAVAPLSLRDHLKLVAIGLLGYYAASFLSFLGLLYVTAALERLILYLTPTIVLAISVTWLGHRVAQRQAIALALSYGGIVLAFWHGASFSGGRVLWGAALVFASAVCYATYLVAAGQLVKRIGAMRLVSYAMTVSSLACFVQFVLLDPWTALQQPIPVYVLSLLNATLSTVLPVFATMLAVARIGAGNAALASTVGPVATIMLGYLFLDEGVSPWQMAGTGLVMTGVYVLSRQAGVAGGTAK
jgi:drug/metabolite transporter (DMT)-like permease